MGMVVRTNMMAINANRNLGKTTKAFQVLLKSWLPVSELTVQATTLQVLLFQKNEGSD